ncbi:hypothetical protein PAPYR_6967 [Paratrimastix pyriformis]|uniref:C2HC/C3H-type domain-containing protein n=1 Tax=Paratrimastix pyriformis TaxID=342808 RepID=A0ABQ8UDZ6_9EUKA|nr:hypothetical protein PAPYR_6967 [Paratrimastix pyriformis]
MSTPAEESSPPPQQPPSPQRSAADAYLRLLSAGGQAGTIQRDAEHIVRKLDLNAADPSTAEAHMKSCDKRAKKQTEGAPAPAGGTNPPPTTTPPPPPTSQPPPLPTSAPPPKPTVAARPLPSPRAPSPAPAAPTSPGPAHHPPAPALASAPAVVAAPQQTPGTPPSPARPMHAAPPPPAQDGDGLAARLQQTMISPEDEAALLQGLDETSELAPPRSRPQHQRANSTPPSESERVEATNNDTTATENTEAFVRVVAPPGGEDGTTEGDELTAEEVNAADLQQADAPRLRSSMQPPAQRGPRRGAVVVASSGGAPPSPASAQAAAAPTNRRETIGGAGAMRRVSLFDRQTANFVPCPTCGRNFAPDRLVAHEKVCQKAPRHVLKVGRAEDPPAAAAQPNASEGPRPATAPSATPHVTVDVIQPPPTARSSGSATSRRSTLGPSAFAAAAASAEAPAAAAPASSIPPPQPRLAAPAHAPRSHIPPAAAQHLPQPQPQMGPTAAPLAATAPAVPSSQAPAATAPTALAAPALTDTGTLLAAIMAKVAGPSPACPPAAPASRLLTVYLASPPAAASSLTRAVGQLVTPRCVLGAAAEVGFDLSPQALGGAASPGAHGQLGQWLCAGEVLLEAHTTLGEVRDRIAEELGVPLPFGLLKRGLVPLHPVQDSHRALDHFQPLASPAAAAAGGTASPGAETLARQHGALAGDTDFVVVVPVTGAPTY